MVRSTGIEAAPTRTSGSIVRSSRDGWMGEIKCPSLGTQSERSGLELRRSRGEVWQPPRWVAGSCPAVALFTLSSNPPGVPMLDARPCPSPLPPASTPGLAVAARRRKEPSDDIGEAVFAPHRDPYWFEF